MKPAEPPHHCVDASADGNFKESWRIKRELEAAMEKLDARLKRVESMVGGPKIGATP